MSPDSEHVTDVTVEASREVMSSEPNVTSFITVFCDVFSPYANTKVSGSPKKFKKVVQIGTNTVETSARLPQQK